jgi:hypothetical protein
MQQAVHLSARLLLGCLVLEKERAPLARQKIKLNQNLTNKKDG